MSKLEDQVSYLVNLTNPNLVGIQFPPLSVPMPITSAQPSPAQPSNTPSWGPGMPFPAPPRLAAAGPDQLPTVQLPATHGRSAADTTTIRTIISHARCVVGIGPVTPAHVQRMEAETLEEKYKHCAIEYLRDELGVDSEEIKDEDIAKAFPPNNTTNFDSIYVQFHRIESADVCITNICIHRNLKLKVFLCIPKKLQDGFGPISKVAYSQ